VTGIVPPALAAEKYCLVRIGERAPARQNDRMSANPRSQTARRVSRTLAGVFVLALCFGSTSRSGAAQEPPQAPATAKLTFDDDMALWTVAIKPDKTRDFEAVIAKLQQALIKSQNPDRQKQVAGWKVMKIDKPLPDGNIAYVHVINPVVRGADYTVMQILYDEFPEERRTLYELYRGAFAQNLSLAVGSIVSTAPTQAP
jgi:hypothetical protein